MTTDRRNPTTPDEWQLVADFSAFCLAVENARLYGLIEGGPEINVDRCRDLLLMAQDRGIESRGPNDLAADPVMWAFLNAGGEPW